jgi:chaperone BCS1
MEQKMVVDSLPESAFHNAGNISSSDPVPGLRLLEFWFPGYVLIYKYLLLAYGFEVTTLVSLGIALWFGTRILRSVWAVVGDLVYKNCMSEITIDKPDEIYDHIMAFLAHKYKFKSSRRLTVETISKSAWELDSENMETKESKGGEGQTKLLNFANQEAKSQPRFTPAIGSHTFWYKGRYFQLRRKEVTVMDQVTFKEKELLTLSCLSRSAEPIKALIQDAKRHYYRRQKGTTMVKRPGPKEMRRGRGGWVKIAERPCRPMETVVLDEEKKDDIINDINEYLSPATARWYANRGIPYRRGYLLHGPPGTGKTSLTFALAGVFGLEIHVVSLQDPTLSEEDLGMLFTNLPARCIVLLEDIDTAGLIRAPTENDEKTAPVVGDQSGNSDFNVLDLAKALKKANQLSEEEKKKCITLSGLLNIIDGKLLLFLSHLFHFRD